MGGEGERMQKDTPMTAEGAARASHITRPQLVTTANSPFAHDRIGTGSLKSMAARRS